MLRAGDYYIAIKNDRFGAWREGDRVKIVEVQMNGELVGFTMESRDRGIWDVSGENFLQHFELIQ